MSWWDALPAIATAVALVTIPGFLLSLALGMRGIFLYGLAPVFSVALSGISAVILSLTGVTWALGTFLAVLLAALLLAGVLGRLLERLLDRSTLHRQAAGRFRLDRPTFLGAAAGLAAGAIATAYNLVRIFEHPENIAQRYDNVYHLNAVRYVLEHGDASTLTLGRLLKPGADVAIYPAAWHGLAAQVAGLFDQSIPLAVNALNIAVAAVVWPVGVLFLTRVVFGPKLLTLAFAGLLSAGFPAFPLGLIDFGPLYPNLLSYSVLPAAVALVVMMLRLRPASDTPLLGLLAALLVSVAALLLAQPNGFVALLALSLPPAAWAWTRWALPRFQQHGLRALLRPVIAAGLASAVFVWVWQSVLIGYDTWEPFTDYGSALGQALTSAPHGRSIPFVIAAGTVLGAAELYRRRSHSWLLGIFAVAVLLYAVSAAAPRGSLRMTLTGSWYQDPQRLASLLPLPTVLIAAFGVSWLLGAIRTWTAKIARLLGAGKHAVLLSMLLSVLVAVTAAVQSQRGAIDHMVLEARAHHTYDGNPTILSPDELALLERVGQEVPADAVIAVNPWNGGALAYAISGREVTQFHMNARSTASSLPALATGLANAGVDSEACEVAREANVRFVLDFGTYYLLDRASAHRYPAFDGVQAASNYELVDEQGEAKLYRVSTCFDG